MSATDGLSMLDEHGVRKAVIPAEVKGRYRTWRDRVYAVLLVIFLALPWLKINGLQAVLLDVPGRRFEIFGMLFLAHDAPLLFFLLIAFALGLAFVTSVWGRVWCGWACPQTVFIEGVYRRIERLAEGGYIERRRLREAEWGARKARLWLTKWFLYFAVSSLFAHSFIAYFAGSTRLLQMIAGPPRENWTYFVLVTFVTAMLMFNFGWFREQFCIIMCPYGRFQGVLMDSRSKTVFYDATRGEPRKGLALRQGQNRGDCVSCNRCVQVCPTGIDIRNGIQMECIACTACIDACDEIMTKVKKPAGLISYRSEFYPAQARKLTQRPRSLVYAALTSLAAAGFVISVLTHKAYSLAVLRAKDAPYQQLEDGTVMNHFKAHLMNQSHVGQDFEFSLPPEAAALRARLTQARPSTELGAGKSAEVHLFLMMPKERFDALGEARVSLHVLERSSGSRQEIPLKLVGPQFVK